MKFSKYSTLAIASTTTISASPRRRQTTEKLLQDLSNFDNLGIAPVDLEPVNFGIPLGRPLLNGPNDIDTGFPGFAGFPGRPVLTVNKCEAPTFVTRCRRHTNQKKYTFDIKTGKCKHYMYDPAPFCLANTANNFDTLEECRSLCEPDFDLPEDRPVVIAKSAGSFGGFNRPTPAKFFGFDDFGLNFGLTSDNGNSNNDNDNNKFKRRGRKNNKKGDCNAEKSVQGYCRGNFGLVYTFDKSTNTCVKIVKGGCDTITSNVFYSERDCESCVV